MYLLENDEDLANLPSPEQLKKMIIVKVVNIAVSHFNVDLYVMCRVCQCCIKYLFCQFLWLYAFFSPSSTNTGCPGPESSVPVSSLLACPINSQVTGHWGEPCNRTGEVHPVDPFHSLDNFSPFLWEFRS